MTSSDEKPGPTAPTPVAKRVVKKAGGRHLVYRINRGPWWFLPRPYALISNIEGSVLIFYGVGQLWATHKKLRRINEWYVRVPRFISRRIVSVIDDLQDRLAEFIESIKELEVIGSIIIERRVIEFHWTVPRGIREDETAKPNREAEINLQFNKLAKAFAQLQLVGKEGAHDVPEDQVQLDGKSSANV